MTGRRVPDAERWRTWTVDPRQPAAESLREAADLLRTGGVVALPTDTFYGLAADPRVPSALARVMAAKGRSADLPLLLLVDTLERAAAVAAPLPARFVALAERFWPGPLTLIASAPAGLPPELVGASGGVALRAPAAPVARALAAAVGGPITGTSANRSGAPPVTRAADLDLDPEAIDGVVDGGTTPGGPPSTIVDVSATPARLLRAGAVPAAALSEALDGRLV